MRLLSSFAHLMYAPLCRPAPPLRPSSVSSRRPVAPATWVTQQTSPARYDPRAHIIAVQEATAHKAHPFPSVVQAAPSTQPHMPPQWQPVSRARVARSVQWRPWRRAFANQGASRTTRGSRHARLAPLAASVLRMGLWRRHRRRVRGTSTFSRLLTGPFAPPRSVATFVTSGSRVTASTRGAVRQVATAHKWVRYSVPSAPRGLS
jgi:hypothetical protein